MNGGFLRQFRGLHAIGLMMILCGCRSLIVLPDGQSSAMISEHNLLRTQLAIRPVPLSRPLHYRPIKGCVFTTVSSPRFSPPRVSHSNVSIRRIRDKLQVVDDTNGRVTNILIGTTGRIYDFNKIDTETDNRVTTETYDGYGKRKLFAARAKPAPRSVDPHVINDISLVIPEYFASPHSAGDIVATVKAEDGTTWATYRYRGMTRFNGRNAMVLDLMRTFESNPQIGPVLVGFDVVDLTTMMPLQLVLGAGQNARLDQISCSE